MSKLDKELAYTYDLYIMPIWRDCFDRFFNEKFGLPKAGQILDVHCGTGGHAIEMARMLSNKGNVVAVDENQEAINLAKAKMSVAKVENLEFIASSTEKLTLSDNSFDLIISDLSLLPVSELEKEIKYLVKLLKPSSKIIFYSASKGSFDEFFSIFWEALYYCQLSEPLQIPLEELIDERSAPDVSEKILQKAGLKHIHSSIKKEVFTYKKAEEFFSSPLMEKYFFDKWFGIVPKEKLGEVQKALEAIIERDRNGYDFDLSIKATLIVGEKSK